jgi:hypothetical protein
MKDKQKGDAGAVNKLLSILVGIKVALNCTSKY